MVAFQHSIARAPRLVSRMLAIVGALGLTAQTAYKDDDPSVNLSVVREINATYACTILATGKSCGGETSTETIQPDGTRTLRAFNNWARQDGQINLILRATEDFKILEGVANVYSGKKYSGTGHFVVSNGAVIASVNGPDGYFTQSTPLPEKYSLLLHPVSADGWHFGQYDMEKGGEQTVQIYTLGGAGKSVLGAFFPVALKYLGKEKITVPAGTFDTDHYQFGKDAQAWTYGPDRIMVQHEYAANGTHYELIKLEVKE